MLAELAVELDRIYQRRDHLSSEIEEVLVAHPLGRLLQTLPGIGPPHGSRILAEIGDGSRFEIGGRFAALRRARSRHPPVPQAPQCRSQVEAGKPSTQGRHVLAAFASLRSPESQDFYSRKRAEGKRHNAAVICLARPRCNVILAMLRTGQPYIPRNPRPPPATGPPDAA